MGLSADRLVLILGCLALAACSAAPDLVKERQRARAPQSALNTGVLVEGVSEGAINAFLAHHSGTEVRTLSTAHGMYELFETDRLQVARDLGVPATNNKFFTWSQVHPQSNRLPVGFEFAPLGPCLDGKIIPDVNIQIQEPAALRNGSTIEGGRIRLDGHATSAGSTSLKTIFVVKPPERLGRSQRIEVSDSLDLLALDLGMYSIFFIAQNSEGVCAIDSVQFLVTANPPFSPPAPSPALPDLKQFTHLAKVSAEASWLKSEGEGITIAVLDTGMDYNHSELAPNVLRNSREIMANGIDDDGNGFVDDDLGYDFVNQDGYPFDDDGHGTHVAGLAGARSFGLARKAKLLPVKVLSGLGGDIGTIAAGIRYAVDRGAQIINMSFGSEGTTPHPLLLSAVAYAKSKGVLLFVAAGNGDAQTGLGFDLDQMPVYPASIDSDNLLSVAADDTLDSLSPYSNFGARTVHLVAPGGLMPVEMIFSCALGGQGGSSFVGLTGTSMAAPIATGIAAQVWSQHPGLKYEDVRAVMMASGPAKNELKSVTASGRQLNALDALKQLDTESLEF